MKVKQVSEHIWSLKTWMIIPIHVWIVKEEDGVTLVDAGMPFMAKGIMKFIDALNVGPLQRIVLTHGHSDHVGAVKKILEKHKVPVYVHRIEIPFMEGEKYYPRRKKLEYNVPKNLVQPLEEADLGNLSAVGSLTPYLTPGHSPGHVVYHHKTDQVLLAGDLFTSKKGQLHQPMAKFTADMAEAVKSSLIIEKLTPKRLEVCHGNTVLNPADQLQAYVRNMEDKLR